MPSSNVLLKHIAGPIEMEEACRRYDTRLTKADRRWLDNFRHIYCTVAIAGTPAKLFARALRYTAR
jgi:hypothetical protein